MTTVTSSTGRIQQRRFEYVKVSSWVLMVCRKRRTRQFHRRVPCSTLETALIFFFYRPKRGICRDQRSPR